MKFIIINNHLTLFLLQKKVLSESEDERPLKTNGKNGHKDDDSFDISDSDAEGKNRPIFN